MRGIDTETVNRPGRGEACLITLSDGRYLEFPKSLDQIFRFLSEHHETVRYMAYNMDFDARALFHEAFVPYRVLETLALFTRAEGPAGIRLDYVPGKFLRMSRGRDAFEVYDLAQFFQRSLKDAARKFLPGEAGKDEIPRDWLGEMDRCLLDGRRDRVIKYALQDAALVPRLFELVRVQFETLGVTPKRWLSSGSLAVKYFEKDLARLPAIPIFWQEGFRRSFYGGRIEIGGLGRVGGTGLKFYDINSAYPWAASVLPGLENSVPVYRGEDWFYNRAVIYGSYQIEAEIPPDWLWGPLAVRDGAETDPLLFPVGRFKTWCGLAGLKLLRRLKLRHRVLKAFEFLRVGQTRPLFPTIPDLYAVRKNPALNIAGKLTLNSLYGKMAEETRKYSPGNPLRAGTLWHGFQQVRAREKYGRHTFFPVSAAITEMVRCRIFETFHQFGPRAYAAMTDGVLVRGELPTGPNLGEWGLKLNVDRAYLFGCGRYYIEGETPDGRPSDEFKFRGFSTARENLEILKKTRGPRCTVFDFRAESLTQYTRGGGISDLNVLKNIPLQYELRDEKRFYSPRPQSIALLFKKWFNGLPWKFQIRGPRGKIDRGIKDPDSGA